MSLLLVINGCHECGAVVESACAPKGPNSAGCTVDTGTIASCTELMLLLPFNVTLYVVAKHNESVYFPCVFSVYVATSAVDSNTNDNHVAVIVA